MADIDLNGVVLHGRYRIERPLGRGGMSAVYLARHLALDCPVAVKFIRDDLIEDETVRVRFEREARAAARLTHPNVVHIHDFGSFERGAYIVMEYIEGVSVRQMLVEQGRLPLDVAADLLLQTSEAIAAAHAAGILHRDIKPENLMVYEDETGRRRVKVVDFGLAKHLEGEATRRLTGQSQMIGTPKYMAPERVTDGGEVDERADVYALAILLWEMLAGHAPFEGTFKEVIAQHLYEEPPPLRSAGIDVPDALEEAIAHALEKDPEMRTPSAVAFSREVSEALDVQLTPSGALLPLGATPSGNFEVTRAMASGPLPQRIDSDAHRTRYEANVDSEATRVRPRLPTLYIPREDGSDERTQDLPIPLEPLPAAAPRRARGWSVAPATIAAVVIATLAFFGGAFAVYHFLSQPAEQAATVAETPAPAPAPEAGPPPGTVTVPGGERTRIVLEMDPKQIRSGAVLSISGGQLEGRQDFPLKRVRGDLAWVISDASRSIPGGLTLDEALAPGETYTLVVRNRDGSTSVPKVKVEPVGEEQRSAAAQ